MPFYRFASGAAIETLRTPLGVCFRRVLDGPPVWSAARPTVARALADARAWLGAPDAPIEVDPSALVEVREVDLGAFGYKLADGPLSRRLYETPEGAYRAAKRALGR